MNDKEFRTGVMADGTRLMQPPSNFIADAKRTLSPAWHGDKVALAVLKGRINDAINALNKLDALKKTLFYGRDNNLISEGQTNSNCVPVDMAMTSGGGFGTIKAADIFHGIIGKATESGELLEALRDCYNGAPLDRVNVIEETGDGFWYDAILLDAMDSDFADAQSRVIAKLRARFPEKFEAEQANVRDLERERAILEQRGGPEGDEAPSLKDGTLGFTASERDPLRHVEATAQFEPTAPVGGTLPVLEAEAKANAAFAAVKAPRPVAVDAMPENTNPELAKSIGERLAPMPGEYATRQPIRKSDVEKKLK